MTDLDLARAALRDLQATLGHDRTLAAKLALALLEAEAARTKGFTGHRFGIDQLVVGRAADAMVNAGDASAHLNDAVDRVAATQARAPDTTCIRHPSRA